MNYISQMQEKIEQLNNTVRKLNRDKEFLEEKFQIKVICLFFLDLTRLIFFIV